MYQNPRTLFQKKLQGLLKTEKEEISEVFQTIFTLQQCLNMEKEPVLDNTNSLILLELYNALDMKTFAKVVTVLSGKSVIFPTEDTLKESIVTVLCFFYKEVEKKNWKEIQGILNIPQLNTIKYGIKIKQLNQFILRQANKGGKQ